MAGSATSAASLQRGLKWFLECNHLARLSATYISVTLVHNALELLPPLLLERMSLQEGWECCLGQGSALRGTCPGNAAAVRWLCCLWWSSHRWEAGAQCAAGLVVRSLHKQNWSWISNSQPPLRRASHPQPPLQRAKHVWNGRQILVVNWLNVDIYISIGSRE